MEGVKLAKTTLQEETYLAFQQFSIVWCGLNGGHSLFTDDRRRNHVGMAGQSDLQDFSRPKKGQRSRRSSRSGRQFQALQITNKLFFPSPKSAFKKCLHLRQPIN